MGSGTRTHECKLRCRSCWRSKPPRKTEAQAGEQAKALNSQLEAATSEAAAERRAAEEVFAREKGIVQNRLIEEVIDRQKRHSKVQQQPRVIGGSTSAHRRAPCPQVDKSEQSADRRPKKSVQTSCCCRVANIALHCLLG